MKISCPQCRKDCELQNPAQAGEQEQVRCSNCNRLINSSDVKNLVPAKPARRIIVVPSTKLETPEQSRHRARPELLAKAKMLVATKHDVNNLGPSNSVIDTREPDNPVPLENSIDPVLVVPEQAIDQQIPPQAPAQLHESNNKPIIRRKWFNIAAVIGAILILSSGLMIRDRVMSVIPSLTDLMALTGYEVNTLGLEFSSVTSKTVTNNGGNILIIEGMIRNTTGEMVKVPAVRLLMRTADKQDIKSWFHEPEQVHLQAGETMMFTTQLFGPPSDVKDIHLKFTKRQKQQAKLN